MLNRRVDSTVSRCDNESPIVKPMDRFTALSETKCGVVTVYKLHRYSAQFTTQRMPWAAISKGTLEHGFLPGECLTETL